MIFQGGGGSGLPIPPPSESAHVLEIDNCPLPRHGFYLNWKSQKVFPLTFEIPENNFTGPRSTAGYMSGHRCLSDCRSRGREFDTGPVPYFRGDYTIISTVSWFIQEGFLSVTSVRPKYILTACSLPKQKSVVRWNDRAEMTIVVDWDVKRQHKQKYFCFMSFLMSLINNKILSWTTKQSETMNLLKSLSRQTVQTRIRQTYFSYDSNCLYSDGRINSVFMHVCRLLNSFKTLIKQFLVLLFAAA